MFVIPRQKTGSHNPRNVYEFNLTLKEHFINKLSLNVVCEKAYCLSRNPFLQNWI
jgi:hypothetical protein